jgi:hypothetical protein
MANILPFNFTIVAQDYLDALKEYHEDAGDYIPIKGLIDQTLRLKEMSEALKVSAEGYEDEAADNLNRLYLRLARKLNPTLYTSVEPFQQQPALGTRFLPDLAPALQLKSMDPDSNDFKFLKSGMLRKINKINFSILEAIRLIENWL